MNVIDIEDADTSIVVPRGRHAWNKGKIVGQKPPLKPKHVWAIRTQLQLKGKHRDLALFNFAIDSNLRGCDVVLVRMIDIAPEGYALSRATVRQKKTGQPVQFEITDNTRSAIDDYLRVFPQKLDSWVFPGRGDGEPHLSTRQYSRLVEEWVALAGLNPMLYGTHSLRRTKASLIYKKTGNLRAVQLLLGHTKIESTVKYLGVEVDDALAISEQVDV